MISGLQVFLLRKNTAT